MGHTKKNKMFLTIKAWIFQEKSIFMLQTLKHEPENE